MRCLLLNKGSKALKVEELLKTERGRERGGYRMPEVSVVIKSWKCHGI